MDFHPFKKRRTLKMEKTFIKSKCKGDWKWGKKNPFISKENKITKKKKKGKKLICQPNDPF
jgi:hypothetical protein